MGDRGKKRARNGRSNSFSDEEPREPTREFGPKREQVLDKLYDRADEFIAFDSHFVGAMLSNVKVLMIGDSLMRGLYKDFLTWLNTDKLAEDKDIKKKAENSYLGDRLIDLSLLDADKVFRQAREYQTDNHYLQFFFTTRVMKDDMEALIQQMISKDDYPDVILINSIIWDLTRYFRVRNDVPYSSTMYQKEIEIESLQKYLDRTSMLLRRLRAVLPPHTMVLWMCFPHCRPAENGHGGMQKMPLTQERNHVIRSVMIDGSFRIAQVVRSAGYDVLDLDFLFRNHGFYNYQKEDGMHWWPAGMRLMSQLTLQFLAKSWGIDTSSYLSRLESDQDEECMEEAENQLRSHAYYSNEVQELHDAITTNTFQSLPRDTSYHLESIIEKGRALAPLTHAEDIAEMKNDERFNSVVTGGDVQLATLMEEVEMEEVEDMANTLAAIAAIMKEKLDAEKKKE